MARYFQVLITVHWQQLIKQICIYLNEILFCWVLKQQFWRVLEQVLLSSETECFSLVDKCSKSLLYWNLNSENNIYIQVSKHFHWKNLSLVMFQVLICNLHQHFYCAWCWLWYSSWHITIITFCLVSLGSIMFNQHDDRLSHHSQPPHGIAVQ